MHPSYIFEDAHRAGRCCILTLKVSKSILFESRKNDLKLRMDWLSQASEQICKTSVVLSPGML